MYWTILVFVCVFTGFVHLTGAAAEAIAKGTGEFDVRRGKKEKTKTAKGNYANL